MYACDRIATTTYEMDGVLGQYLRNVSEQWLKVAPLANPAMLEMFRDRDRKPYRDAVPWAGEFAGKYLTSAVQVLRLTGDKQLRACLEAFVGELVSLQAENGYLGPWPKEYALTNTTVRNKGSIEDTWDTWGHYHVMMGLMLWHEETGDRAALKCVRGMADLICEKYLGDKRPRLVETRSTEMNLAPAHCLCLLYKKTGEQRYLDMAKQIVEEFAASNDQGQPLAGDYLNGPLAGKEFYQLPSHRWESLHPIMALSELYTIIGDAKYREAFERIWRSIARTDRHNNGGFSSGEAAQGDPYNQGAIETCCTIAWVALSVEMLRLTGDPLVGDELELSTLNSVTGMHSASGRWATYNTPMDGVRLAFITEHPWQARAGSPELNCCSVNSPRGFGMASDWALMKDADGLVLNWYGPCRMTADLENGLRVTLQQETDYPWDGQVGLRVTPSKTAKFPLKLRIPRWSQKTEVLVNGERVTGAKPGAYLVLDRKWKKGDTVELAFDMSFHFWKGEQACEGKTSVYRGPILLAYDRRYNDMDPDDVPALDARQLTARKVRWSHWLPPQLLLEFTALDGRRVRLCDFGSAGAGGTPYRSWLPVQREGVELPQYFAAGSAAR